MLYIVGKYPEKIEKKEMVLGMAVETRKDELLDRAGRLASQLDEKRNDPDFPYDYPEQIQVKDEAGNVVWDFDEEDREI